MDRQDCLSRLFGRYRPGVVEDWAAIEALAPGTVSNLPGDMQKQLFLRCLLKLQEQCPPEFREPFDKASPCSIHKLWGVLLTTVPCWTCAGFLEVGHRKYDDSFGWLAPSVTAARLFWALLVEMGACCAAERKKALLVLEAKKAPLEILLCYMRPRDEDDFHPGEKELVWYLLERAPTEFVRIAHEAWRLGMDFTWWKCCRRAEKVLRWRGLREAWVSAVVRAGQVPT